ncbi:MAG: HAD-IC family P-type ATPase [bacterium]|nr:HAD-IC family P-type ATPase [bacterium]
MKHIGLSSARVKELKAKYGANVLPEGKEVSPIRIFLSQFANPLIFLLLFAGVISLLSKEYLEIAFIFLVVLLNSAFGFFQEYKAQRTMAALKKLIRPLARVIRDGQRQEIEVSDLVPGDIVFLAVGDKVPADAKVLEAVSLFANEAILTGESEPVEKNPGDEAYMGTIIAGGRAVIRVTKIGLTTEMGEIASALEQTSQPLTTLQLRLKRFTRSIVYFSVFLSFLVLVSGFLAGRDFWQMVQTASVILVAIIPEALLIVVTLILVIATQKILKRKALIRKLLAVETLGSVTTICIDKTGTLTEGEMKVSEADFKDRESSLLTMSLCNDISSPEEIAIWDYLRSQKGFSPENVSDKYQRISEILFSSEHKFMATVNSSPEEGTFLFVKGAPEIVLAMTSLAEGSRLQVLAKMDELAGKGLKVIGLAFQKVSSAEAKEISLGNMPSLQWGGMIGLWDPPRKEAKETILIAKKAGIKIKVVTGDYRRTSEKIMEFLGMKVEPDEVLEGHEMRKLSDEDLRARVPGILLFSRVTPNQKLRIVKALQELGEIVAMTGDGVNDAPALKKSNIGIVMAEASEVAKETADMILLDSNFKTIISAIEEGRVVFENLRKVIFFMLSNSFAEIVLILGSIFLGWPLPLTIVQILWLHLLCDGPEDVVLGFEPKEKEVMAEGPKAIAEPILNRFSVFLIFLVSFLSGLFSLGLFWYFGLHLGMIELGRTMAFMAISFESVLYIFSCRTFRKPFWKYENFWSNKWLFAAVFASLGLQISITYLPLTQRLLNIVPLNLVDWGLLLAAAAIIIIIIELAKAVNQSKKKLF